MQLNPARGRKLEFHVVSPQGFGVYAAQPREGTETRHRYLRHHARRSERFMQLNPARGRKPVVVITLEASFLPRFMQLNPARGRKQGNYAAHRRKPERVYAAQPREGTETC